jgi:recombinational DNA repair protein (RecF pathway)
MPLFDRNRSHTSLRLARERRQLETKMQAASASTAAQLSLSYCTLATLQLLNQYAEKLVQQ